MRWQMPIWSFAVLSVVLISYVNCTGYYTIVAPENIHPYMDYQISTTLHDHTEPTSVRFSITDGIAYNNSKTVTINTNETTLTTLHIETLNVTNGYKFVAEGLTGFIFKNESQLKVQSKNVSIFIQSDKSIYKPGETMKFLVVVLDYELKPVDLTDSHLDVFVTDPEKNRIKQWLKVSLTKGVFSSEIGLSDVPILGEWKFTATIGEEKTEHVVQVNEYVLPKFDISIDSPDAFSIKDGKVRAVIRSKYTYGQFVKGEAIVTLAQSSNWWTSTPLDTVIKTIPIDGKGTVEFDIENDLKLDSTNPNNRFYYDLKATVIEGLTGRNQSTSKDISIHSTRYQFDHEYFSAFIPGVPVTFWVKVRRHDNAPILITEETKWLTVGKIINQYSVNENVTYFKFPINSTGMADVQIPTRSNETSFSLQVKYMDEDYMLGYYYPASIVEPAELDIKVLTKRPTLNENVFVEVQSNVEMKNFTYQVVAHGKIVHAGNVAVPDRTYHVIKFNATFAMAPRAKIIVYRFKDNDIIAANTEIQVDEQLNNFVKVKLSKNEAQPGNEIAIDIITNPSSYVGLFGVDQSVLLLKENKGITKEDAFESTNDYDRRFHSVAEGPWTVPYRYYNQHYFNHFRNSDVIFFTNAKQDLYQPKPIPYKRKYAYYASAALGGVANAAEAAFFPSTINLQSSISANRVLGSTAPPPRIRKEFPETWLWEGLNVTNANGTITLHKTVPDTITSWVISSLSVHSMFGLGLSKSPKTLKVFQPFFISLNLPYSVKRNEVVAIPIVLFNYLDHDAETELSVYNAGEKFEFVDNSVDKFATRSRKITVPSNNGITTTFLLRFTSVGEITLKVQAISALAGDAIERAVRVEPEGVPQFVNKAVFVDLRESSELVRVEKVEVPKNAVPDSWKINVNVIGDLLGGAIQNLQNLIRLPTGCGEQNLLKFVPNVVILDYLKTVNNLKPAIESKARKYLLAGYQRELSYRHRDGSFSSFGNLDKKGSTWLTAFVAKSFKQADRYIDVDEQIITDALKWLEGVQREDGSFPEIGQISHRTLQSDANKGVALTAYTVIAFLRNKKTSNWAYEAAVEKAVKNIASNINSIDDPYTVSIAAYALQLANHPQKSQVLEKLLKKSISAAQLKWFSKPLTGGRQSKSINVEMTSYGVLALVEAKQLADALPFFRWLLAQRNDQGGFVGTQDTVIGLEALAKYAEHLSTTDNNVQLKIEYGSSNETYLNVNRENALVLQTVSLPSNTKEVHLTSTGHGFALFQLSYRYNLDESDVPLTFSLETNVAKITSGHLTVEICSSFNPKSDEEKQSNMVVLEVSMPSGFIADKEQFPSLLKEDHVKLVETKKGETVVNVYFDQMLPNERKCLNIEGYRSHKVAESKPSSVKIYDYYDSSQVTQNFYSIPLITSCDICEGDECSQSCH